MGQYKIYLNISMQLLLGFSYSKGCSFEINILCFVIGIGLTESAEGFGFWLK